MSSTHPAPAFRFSKAGYVLGAVAIFTGLNVEDASATPNMGALVAFVIGVVTIVPLAIWLRKTHPDAYPAEDADPIMTGIYRGVFAACFCGLMVVIGHRGVELLLQARWNR